MKEKITKPMAMISLLLILAASTGILTSVTTAHSQTNRSAIPSSNLSSLNLLPTIKTGIFHATTLPFTPFQGQSIKLFDVTSWLRASQWQPIDSYISHGYEIKAIVPRQTASHTQHYIVVLETTHRLP